MQTNLGKSEKQPITPFTITQAVVGMELGLVDKPVLAYFDFFVSRIPVSAAFFIHVLPRLEIFNLSEENKDYFFDGEGVEVSDEKINEMEACIKQHFHSGEKIYVEYNVKMGDPLEEVLAEAMEYRADLMVIGQKTTDEWHGILARNLAREVSTNALIIPDKAKKQLKSILVPVDFSPNSIKALETAIGIKKQLGDGVQLICLHVYDMPDMSFYKISRSIDQMKKIVEDNIQVGMEAFLHTVAGDDKNLIETKLVQKDMPGVASYIIDYAEEQEVDFMVMGAKGYSKVELLLMGSVTEKVLNLDKKIPVLVVK